MYGIRRPEHGLPFSLVPAFLFDAPRVAVLGIEQGDACPAQDGAPEKDIIEGRGADEDVRRAGCQLLPQGPDGGGIAGKDVMPQSQAVGQSKAGRRAGRAPGEGRDLVAAAGHLHRQSGDHVFQTAGAANVVKVQSDVHVVYCRLMMLRHVRRSLRRNQGI